MVTKIAAEVYEIPQEFRFSLEESTKKIRMLSKRTVEGIVEIGRELKRVKGHLEHGLWEKWVGEELGWHPATAWRFMQAATRYESLASTQELDEQAFIQELWGNVPKTEQPKSQEDVLKWLERELDRQHQKLFHLLSQLTFCGHLTPIIAGKLRNLAGAITDVVKNCEPEANRNLN